MNQYNKNFWTERYQKNDTGWDVGTISDPIKNYIDQLNDKNISILIPGAGNAYEAEYIFNKEFRNVTVLDISEEPIANFKKRLPNFSIENAIVGDFFQHEKKYDLIIEQTFFCALDKSFRKKYVEKMYELLNPKGKLVGVLFTEPLNNTNPPFAATEMEYRNFFQNYFNFKTFERCYNSIKPRAGRELFVNLERK